MNHVHARFFGILIGLGTGIAFPVTLFAQVNVGANFQTQTVVDSTPPDTMGAVGLNHWVQFNNDGYTVFNKNGSSAAARVSPTTFWQNAGLTPGTVTDLSDPRLAFDPLSGRWIAAMISINEATNNRVLIARSNTSNPLDGFKAVSLTTSNNLFADYPTLGIDRNGVYIGTNNFTAGGAFSNVGLYSVPKADLLLTTPTLVNATQFGSLNPDTTIGYTSQVVTNYNLGQTNSTAASVYAVNNVNFSQVNVTPLTGTTLPGATLGGTSVINVATTSYAPTARQPNSTNTAVSGFRMDTLDDRFGSSVYRVGNLVYSVHGVAQSSRSALRITVLNATTNAVVAESTLGEANFDYYIGSIAANAQGDVVVGYTRSGFVASGNATNRNPSATVSVGTLVGSTLSLGTQVEVRRGLAEYIGVNAAEGTAVGVKRWGDYSATNVDPTDPGIFWSSQEYVAGNTNTQSQTWATQASEIIPTVTGEKRWASVSALNPDGITGNFATAANWYDGVVPTATDHVIFSRNGDGTTSYAVTMPAGTTVNDRASVRQGVVTLSVPNGATYSLTNAVETTPSLAVAEYLGRASLTVSGGGTLQTVTTTIAAGINSEGTTNPSNGTLSVAGAGTTWNNTGNVYVGGNNLVSGGLGTLNVTNGASATVTGTLTLWNTASGVNVGTAGSGGTVSTGQLTNASGSAPVINLVNVGSQFNVNGSGASNYTGTIVGAGAVTKSGSGVLTLGGANTYTGGTTIAGGTLQMGAANVLPTTGTVTLSGGTLSTGVTAGNANAVGPLTLAADSTISLGAGVHTLSFADINASPVGTLTILGWTGTIGASGTNGKILFGGASLNATYTTFLTHVQFSGFGLGDAQFIGSAGAFELVPVPEPSTYLAVSVASLGVVGLVRRRVLRETVAGVAA